MQEKVVRSCLRKIDQLNRSLEIKSKVVNQSEYLSEQAFELFPKVKLPPTPHHTLLSQLLMPCQKEKIKKKNKEKGELIGRSATFGKMAH